MANRPHMINGKNVETKRAVPREQSNFLEASMPTNRLYINGICEEHSEQMLQEYFDKYGKVVEVSRLLIRAQ